MKRGENMSDGSLRFDTKVDDSEVKKSRTDIIKAFEGIIQSVKKTANSTASALSGMTSQQLHYTNELNKTNEKLKEYEANIQALKNEKTPTKEYAELQEQLKDAEKILQGLLEKKRQYNDLGFSDSQSPTLMKNISTVNSEISQIKQKMSELSKSGQAETMSEKAASGLEKLNQKLADGRTKAEELKKKLEEIQNKDKPPSLLDRLKESFSKVGSAAVSFGKKIAAIFKKGKSQSNDFAKSFFRIGNMLKSRVLRSIVSAIVNGIKNGFQNLAKYSESFNKSISGLKSSFSQLGNTVMTAVAPVIQALVPIIQAVIDKIIEAINVVAQFTARLFGNANTFTKAKKVNEDYAKSLGKTGKAEKKLLSFDTIEKLTNDSSGSGGTDASQMFETQQIENSISDFADKIKESINNGDWYGVGSLLGEKVNSIFNNIDFDSIGRKIGTKVNNIFSTGLGFLRTVNWKNIGSTFASGLNNMISTINFETIGNTFGAGLNAIIYTAYGFVSTFDWSIFGQSLSDGVNGFFSEVDFATAGLTFSNGLSGIFDMAWNFLENVNWEEATLKVMDFLKNIKWGEIVASMARAFGAALGGFGKMIYTFIVDTATELAQYFYEETQQCGGNVWKGFCKGVVDALYNLGKFIVEDIWNPFITGFKNAFGIHSPSTKMAEMGNFVVEGFLNGIKEKWEGLKKKVSELCSGLVDKVKGIFGIHSPSTVMAGIGENITEGMEQGIGDGNGAFDGISVLSSETVDDLKSAWSGIGNWFSSEVTEPLKKVLDDFSKHFDENMKKITDSIKTSVVLSINYINIMINSLQTYLNQVIRAVNSIIREINAMSGETGITLPYVGMAKLENIPLPKLATGTVVPANFGEFAAILGDNKREPEIISPYSTMKQAFVDALSETGGQDININFTGSLAQFIRMLNPEIKRENGRIGNSTRMGGAY